MTIYCKTYEDLVLVQDELMWLMKEFGVDFTGIKLQVGPTSHGWEIDYPKPNESYTIGIDAYDKRYNGGC